MQKGLLPSIKLRRLLGESYKTPKFCYPFQIHFILHYHLMAASLIVILYMIPTFVSKPHENVELLSEHYLIEILPTKEISTRPSFSKRAFPVFTISKISWFYQTLSVVR